MAPRARTERMLVNGRVDRRLFLLEKGETRLRDGITDLR